jgi:D-glycero-D-manno-heptose 1,7-bisphosphate phosphatase
MTVPALILDRDGVVNHDRGFVHRIEDCAFIDGIFALTAAFAAQGFAIVIATNQSGIGRGLYDEAAFASLTDWMTARFAEHGVTIAATYHAPDHPTEGKGRYRRDSQRRKPMPGMLLRAAAEHDLDLARSWCLGDRMSDIAAGQAAGIGTLVLFAPETPAPAWRDTHWVVPRLPDVVELLARLSQPRLHANQG